MTKLAIIFFAIGSIAMSGYQNNENKHIGEWKGIDNEGKGGSLILDKSNHAVFVIEDAVLGGEAFEMKGKKAECKFEIDYSKNPIWLDIVFYEKGKNSEMARMKGIVRFVTDTRIEFRLNFEGGRFDKFDPEDKDNTIILDKVMK